MGRRRGAGAKGAARAGAIRPTRSGVISFEGFKKTFDSRTKFQKSIANAQSRPAHVPIRCEETETDPLPAPAGGSVVEPGRARMLAHRPGGGNVVAMRV